METIERPGVENRIAWPLMVKDLQVHHGVHPVHMPFGSYPVVTGVDASVDGHCRRSKGNRLWGDLIRNATYVAAYPNNAGITDFRLRGPWDIYPFNIQATGKDVRVYGFVVWFPDSNDATTEGRAWVAYKVEGYHDVSPGSPEDPYTRPFEWAQVLNTEESGGAAIKMLQRPCVTSQGRFVYIANPEPNVPNMTLWFDWNRWSLGGNNGAANWGGWRSDYFGVPPTPTQNMTSELEPSLHAGININIAGTLYTKPPITVVSGGRVINAVPNELSEGQLEFHLYVPGTNLLVAPYKLMIRRDAEAGFTDTTAANLVQITNPAAGYYIFKLAPNAETFNRTFYYRFEDSSGPVLVHGFTNTAAGIPFRAFIAAGKSKEGIYRAGYRLVDTNRSRYGNLAKHNLNRTNSNSEFSLAVATTTANGSQRCGNHQYGSYSLATVATASTWGPVNAVSKQWDQYQLWHTASGPGVDVDPGDVFNLGDQMITDADWRTGPLGDSGGDAYIVKHVRVMHNTTRNDVAGNTSQTSPDNMPFTDESLAAADPISGQYNPKSHQYRVWATADVDFPLNPIQAITTYQELTVAVILEDDSVKLVWSDGVQFAPENFPIGNVYELGYQGTENLCFVECADYLYLFGDGPVYQIRRDGIFLDVVRLKGRHAVVSRTAAASIGEVAMVVTPRGIYAMDGVSGSFTRLKGLDRVMRDRWSNRRLHRYIQVSYDTDQDACYILSPGTAETITIWMSANKVTMQDGATFSFLRTLKTINPGRGWSERSFFVTWHGKFCYPIPAEEPTTYDNYTMHGLTDGFGVTAPGTWNARVASSSPATTVNGVTVTVLTLETSVGAPWTHTPNILSGGSLAFLTGIRQGQLHQLWWNDGTVGAATIRVYGNIHSASLVGSWVALSPVPMTLLSAPIPGSSARIFHQRINVDASQWVTSKLLGSDVANMANFSPVRFGTSQLQAQLTMEPLASPDAATDVDSALLLIPDSGALSRWVSLTDASVFLGDGTLAELTIQAHGLNPPDGVAQAALFPIWVCDTSSVVFDLLSLEFRGIIYPTEISDSVG